MPRACRHASTCVWLTGGNRQVPPTLWWSGILFVSWRRFYFCWRLYSCENRQMRTEHSQSQLVRTRDTTQRFPFQADWLSPFLLHSESGELQKKMVMLCWTLRFQPKCTMFTKAATCWELVSRLRRQTGREGGQVRAKPSGNKANWVHKLETRVSPLWFPGSLGVLATNQVSVVVLPSGFPPHLENLEKQGQTWKTWKNRRFWGKNLEKYCKTWKKKFDLTVKKPQEPWQKNYLKKI